MRNKIGRNDLCHCASGLKYKKCCLKSKEINDKNARLRHIQEKFKEKLGDVAQEVVFLEPNSQSLKMSEILLEFAEDLIDEANSRSEKKKTIDLACLAWNLALIKEKSDEQYEAQLNSFLKQMGINQQADRNGIRSVLNALVDKKISQYSTIDRFIVNYQVDFIRDELTLNVASTISTF